MKTLTEIIQVVQDAWNASTQDNEKWFYFNRGQVRRVTNCEDLGCETFKERICEINNGAYVGEEKADAVGRFIALAHNFMPELLAAVNSLTLDVKMLQISIDERDVKIAMLRTERNNLAHKFQVSPSTISRWASNGVNPRIRDMAKREYGTNVPDPSLPFPGANNANCDNPDGPCSCGAWHKRNES